MSSSDRQPHKTATVIDQQFLDFSMDNLENDLRLTVDIEVPKGFIPSVAVTFTASSALVASTENLKLLVDDAVSFSTTGTLPAELTAGTRYYVVIVTDYQNVVVSATIGGPGIVPLSTGTGDHSIIEDAPSIRASDRNMYKGGKFYQATTRFPVIRRTIGEWLSPVVEFSSFSLSLNNVNGQLNSLLPGGSLYEGFINKRIIVQLGLRDVEATYFTIFKGFISEVGGFKRDTSVIKFTARDDFNKLNEDFPTVVFSTSTYPKISNDLIGTPLPVIYGDWQSVVDVEGNIPAIVVNSKDPQLELQEVPVLITIGTPTNVFYEDHRFTADAKVQFTTDGTLPTGMSLATDYYVKLIDDDNFEFSTVPAGASVNTTASGTGQHSVEPQDRVNISLVNSVNDLSSFDLDNVWVKKGDFIHRINSVDITNVDGAFKSFEIVQDSGNTLIDGANFLFESGDEYTVHVKGPIIAGGYDDNAVEQARQILLAFSPAVASDFDANWDTIRDKATPAQSAIFDIKSRIWKQDSSSALQYALSLLEQVRVEAFISRDLKIKLRTLHFEDWEPDPSFVVRNIDVEMSSLKVTIDERNNFNAAQGFFDFNPKTGENRRRTKVQRNQAAIDQAVSKRIAKQIEFPNLYVELDVTNQVVEAVSLASSYSELPSLSITNRSLLRDIGDFVKMTVNIGSTNWDEVPMMIRDFSINPKGLKIDLKLWSFEMTPFANPSGWDPGTSGIVGGDTATITEE